MNRSQIRRRIKERGKKNEEKGNTVNLINYKSSIRTKTLRRYKLAKNYMKKDVMSLK